MRKLLLYFIVFAAAFWALGHANLPELVVGIAIAMAIMAGMHVLATPEN